MGWFGSHPTLQAGPGTAFRGVVRSIRCSGCGGELNSTMLRRKPVAEEHLKGCREYHLALHVMQYSEKLRQVTSSSSPEWQKSCARAADDLARVACSSSVSQGLESLTQRYHEAARGSKGTRGRYVCAATLAQICQALAEGNAPDDVPVPNLDHAPQRARVLRLLTPWRRRGAKSV